ncbi:MAG: DNA internalization-related competence protein ComEC/Rec2 [Tissierellia bacterium]|nr:DNA internalization-related competence protein ComEC/Rec2 [Tissierellia bacterium]
MASPWILAPLAVGAGAALITRGLFFAMVPGLLLLTWAVAKRRRGIFLLAVVVLLSTFRTGLIHREFQREQLPHRVSGRGAVLSVGEGFIEVAHGGRRLPIYTQEPFALGEVVAFRGKTRPLLPAMNPGNDSAFLTALSYGTSAPLQPTQLVRTGEREYLHWLRGRVHQWARGQLERVSTHPELFMRLIFNEGQGGVDLAAYESLDLIHLLSISGLHLGVILLLLEEIFRRLTLPYTPGRVLLFFLLLSYLFLAGFPVGGMRILLSLSFRQLALLLGYRPNGHYALGFSATVLLILWPFTALRRGFLFSYGAALALIQLRAPLASLLFSREGPLSRSLSSSLAISLGNLPLLLESQGGFSLVGILANTVMIPIYTAILVLGILLLPLASVPLLGPGLGIAADGLVGLSAQLVGALAQAAWKFPLGAMAPFPALLYLAALYLLPGLVSDFSRNMGRLLILQGLISLALLLTLGPGLLPAFQVTQLYVGQGDCAHIAQGGYNFLVDTGGSPFGGQPTQTYVLPYLKAQGIHQLDAVFISHFDEDHMGGLGELLEEIKVKRIIAAAPPAGERPPQLPQKIHYLEEFYWEAEGFSLRSIPHPLGREENDRSQILLWTFPQGSFLFTGDLSREAEDEILWPRATVLKVGHHGSKTSTGPQLLREVDPQLALISAGVGNAYGHPHREVTEALRKRGIPTLSTQQLGAIHITPKGAGLAVRGHLEDRGSLPFTLAYGLLLTAVSFYLTLELRK